VEKIGSGIDRIQNLFTSNAREGYHHDL
jgi:hypothetical protein